jgi:hypothetical protein
MRRINRFVALATLTCAFLVGGNIAPNPAFAVDGCEHTNTVTVSGWEGAGSPVQRHATDDWSANFCTGTVITLFKTDAKGELFTLDGKGAEKVATFSFYLTKNDAMAGTNPIEVEIGETSTLVLATQHGKATFKVPDGTYWMVEKSTAPGYNLLPSPIEIQVTSKGITVQPGILVTNHCHSSAATDETVCLTVANTSSHQLPLSGSQGTMLFTLLGVCGVPVVILIGKKMRRSYA